MGPQQIPSSTQRQCPSGTVTGCRFGEYETYFSIPFSTTSTDFSEPKLLFHAGNISAETPEARDVGLSITVPIGTRAGQDLPVIAFIHGGRYEHGHYDSPGYTGKGFAKSGCIFVSIGYRRQFEGFANFPGSIPGQYRGVQDCATALEWLQHNIESFGGDPTNITLMGQSAGGGIALWLSRRDHYCGAFRRVIALSPAFPRQGFHTRIKTLNLLTLGKGTKEYLTELSIEKRSRIYWRFRNFYLDDMALGPYPFDPEEFAEVPMLLSSTREEMFLEPTAKLFDSLRMHKLVIQTRGRTFGTTNPKRYIEEMERLGLNRISGHFIGDSTIRRWVSSTAEHAPGPRWLMEFTGVEGLPACHCVDLPLIFNDLYTNPPRITQLLGPNAPKTHAQLAQKVHDIALSFARGETPQWPKYSPQSRICRSISLNGNISVSHDPLRIIRESFACAA